MASADGRGRRLVVAAGLLVAALIGHQLATSGWRFDASAAWAFGPSRR